MNKVMLNLYALVEAAILVKFKTNLVILIIAKMENKVIKLRGQLLLLAVHVILL